jgi:F-type H+-transporting ATPase subunit b
VITPLTFFAAEEGHEETVTGIAALGIDPKAFIIQLITFLLVFLILRKFVFTKVVDALQKREETIQKGVSLTTDLVKQKEELDREAAEIRRKARKEADQIVSDSQAQASTMIKEAEESAQTKADLALEEARKKIADETARARRQLETEMVDLVIQATEKVSGEKLDAKKDNALITSALKGQA